MTCLDPNTHWERAHSDLPSKKIYLFWMTGRDFFRALLIKALLDLFHLSVTQ